jgi:hypothetical protein
MNIKTIMTGSIFALACFGCAQIDTDSNSGDDLKERWDSRNDPTRFRGISLKYNLDDLPTSGRAEREVWPSTYWATYQDSINVRWSSGELSPAEKYDKAFNGWTPEEGFMALRPYKNGSTCADYDKSYYEKLGPLANLISGQMGNGKARDGVDNDGDGEIDECDDRDGVETWFGLCHAWVPAAMLEDRPLRTIEHNGVIFHPGDLEALIITAYNRAGADMIGGRCNEKDKEIERDEQGRPLEVGCRDTNAGTLHVIMANYLGINRTAFAEDRTFDYEVWNQPVVAYDISKMEELTAAQALEKLGLEGETYTITPDAAFFYDVNASMTYITESHASTEPANAANFERTDRYTYILELDAERNVIGGEWYGSSSRKHPDFLWSPRRASFSSVRHLDLDKVRELIALSRAPETTVVNAEPIILETTPDVAIPDNDENGITVELVAPTGIKGRVSVTALFSHEDLAQVKVGLLSPTGESWELVAAGTLSGDTYFEETFELDPQPIGELTGSWKMVFADIEAEKTGIVEQFKMTVIQE